MVPFVGYEEIIVLKRRLVKLLRSVQQFGKLVGLIKLNLKNSVWIILKMRAIIPWMSSKIIS